MFVLLMLGPEHSFMTVKHLEAAVNSHFFHLINYFWRNIMPITMERLRPPFWVPLVYLGKQSNQKRQTAGMIGPRYPSSRLCSSSIFAHDDKRRFGRKQKKMKQMTDRPEKQFLESCKQIFEGNKLFYVHRGNFLFSVSCCGLDAMLEGDSVAGIR